jgi:hypothetical protein
MEFAVKRRGFIVQFLMGFILTTGIVILAGSVADQMYLKNAYFEAKNLTDKAALAAAKKYQETFSETVAVAAARAISANNKVFGSDLKDELVFTFDASHTRVTAMLPHYEFKTFWLRALNLNAVNVNNVFSSAYIYQPLSSEKITPFLINNKNLKPGDSVALTFNNAGVKGSSYDPNNMTAFYPIELTRTSYLNYDGTDASMPSNGSGEKVLRYTDNIIFGAEESVSSGDVAFLENDNNPAFGNVDSTLNGLDNGFPNFFNSDAVDAATFVALATLKLRSAGITDATALATNLNSILNTLDHKSDWPTPYITVPIESKPELYIAVSNGTKTTETQSTKTIVQEVIKVRLESLVVNKPSNKHSSTATVQANFTVVYTPPRLIE